MEMTASTAASFLPFATPIALWVAWSDMKSMRIPNNAVYALVAVFAVIGLVALPLETYLWRWLHLVVVLVIGFGINMMKLIGGGDAKFAAAMAPFVAFGDIGIFCYLFSAVLLASFLLHRGARAIPVLRRATPNWESWQRKDFPMGLALGSGLIAYLVLAFLRTA